MKHKLPTVHELAEGALAVRPRGGMEHAYRGRLLRRRPPRTREAVAKTLKEHPRAQSLVVIVDWETADKTVAMLP